MKKADIIAAATAGLVSGFALAPTMAAAEESKMETEKCYGINKCKAHSSCGVSKDDIKATMEVFKDKFAKSAIHDCSGLGKCASKGGQLNWIPVAKDNCTNIEGGFLIVQSKDGKRTVMQ